ncbi:HXXEE domain-containing protein [Schleiferilactobacillus harbinensis]|uniref:HXXEE domain-containing protein n=1 Tax=Schleiferilactobacillus harbinensis TaxID=304207 RepID=UPI00123C09AB|nr:HXXEE domain-containing protein [Schleiferilactobacillus harbinensis]QEU48527.1 HXXEE domain-containing protein [Schleiferilactobacillus harbinensis]
MTAFTSYWLLPLFFMFHDFEELVFVPTWLRRQPNRRILGRIPFAGVDQADILAVGIWEEFVLYWVFSAVGYWLHTPLLIVAATIPYLGHLVGHLVFIIIVRGYVPGGVTAALELPFVTWYLIRLVLLVNAPVSAWWLSIGLMTLLFFGNLLLIHFVMSRIAAS